MKFAFVYAGGTLQEPKVNAAAGAAAENKSVAADYGTPATQINSPDVSMTGGFSVDLARSPGVLQHDGRDVFEDEKAAPAAPKKRKKPQKKRPKRSSNAGYNLNIAKTRGERTLWLERFPGAKTR